MPKARLDGTLRNLVNWKVCLIMAGALELDDLSFPFHPKLFYVSFIYLNKCKIDSYKQSGDRKTLSK